MSNNTFYIAQDPEGGVLCHNHFINCTTMVPIDVMAPKLFMSEEAAESALIDYITEWALDEEIEDAIADRGIEIVPVRVVIGGLAGGNVL